MKEMEEAYSYYCWACMNVHKVGDVAYELHKEKWLSVSKTAELREPKNTRNPQPKKAMEAVSEFHSPRCL